MVKWKYMFDRKSLLQKINFMGGFYNFGKISWGISIIAHNLGDAYVIFPLQNYHNLTIKLPKNLHLKDSFSKNNGLNFIFTNQVLIRFYS